MKLKGLFVSVILCILSFSFAQTHAQKAELKASINEMILLIDQNKILELVDKYAYIPDAEKIIFIEDIKSNNVSKNDTNFREMRANLITALKIEPTFENGRFVFTASNNETMTFIKVNNFWQLQDN